MRTRLRPTTWLLLALAATMAVLLFVTPGPPETPEPATGPEIIFDHSEIADFQPPACSKEQCRAMLSQYCAPTTGLAPGTVLRKPRVQSISVRRTGGVWTCTAECTEGDPDEVTMVCDVGLLTEPS